MSSSDSQPTQNESTSTEVKGQHNDPSFRSAAIITALIIGVIALAAIVPNILDYCLQKEVLSTNRASILLSDSAFKFPANDSAVIALKDSLLRSIRNSTLTINSRGDSSKTYESYAQLVTLLIGLLSALGIFAGYFVRKSIREVEVDMREELKRQMNIWDREREQDKTFLDDLKSKYTKSVKECEEMLEHLRTLEDQLPDPLKNQAKKSERIDTKNIASELDGSLD